MNHPIGPYRNAACQALAEKVARGDSWRTLDVTINIDQMLKGSRAEVGEQVLQALNDNSPFVLYDDASNYYMVFPEQRLLICVQDGIEKAKTVSQTEKEFANNIRIAIAAYNNFLRMNEQIEHKDKKLLGESK